MISSDEHASGSVTPPPSTTTAEATARPTSANAAAAAPALITRRAFEAWASAMVRRRLGNRLR